MSILEAKHNVKRRIAKTSFATILAIIPMIFYIVLTANENTAVALNSASGILIMILTCLTTIVVTYMGISHHSDIVSQEK